MSEGNLKKKIIIIIKKHDDPIARSEILDTGIGDEIQILSDLLALVQENAIKIFEKNGQKLYLIV